MKQMNRAALPAAKPARRRRWWRYPLMALGGLIFVLALATAFLLFWLVWRPLPQTGGELKLAGLQAEVKVVRDKWGVPHISAANAADLFLAQGFVTAQDRLWQLDFNRRVGAGRLSEVLGSAAIEQDRYLRTIGLRRAAEAELPDLPAEDRAILESYARGVNVYIDSHQDNLPLEFTLLGFKPEPWTVLDSLTWGKVMAFDLSDNYEKEVLRASLVEKFGAEQAALLMPTSAAPNTPLIVPPGVAYKGIEPALALGRIQRELAVLAGGPAERGSNNWVVAGSRSATGRPIVANDPHLGLRNPSVWYEVALQGGGWNVAGVTFPGVPGVVIGHNERIAWAVTNATGDTQDLFIEKINPANPDQYEYQGVWQDMRVIQEEIKIKGKPAEQLKVRLTRHGPIMNGVDSTFKDTPPMALQWVALQKSPLLSSVIKYNRAQNWQQFREALRGFSVPAQNFVYADVDGNIGYQLPGMWPLRPKGGKGLLPVPGWTGEYEWEGFVPFEELPTLYNPPSGLIVTANNRQAGLNAAGRPFIGDEFDPGWRATRITQLLQAKDKLSLSDMGAIHSDVLTIPGQEVAGYLAKLPASGNLAGPVQRLAAWDGRLTPGSVGGAIYKVTYQYMVENIFRQKLGNTYEAYLAEGRFHLPLILTLLKDPQNQWWGTGGRDALLQKSLEQAVAYLTGRFGGNPDDWKWGKLHTQSFAQTPIGGAVPGPLALIMNLKTVENGGDGTTVSAASYRYTKPYEQNSGVSFRGLFNLANFDESLIVNSGGQSGQPFSPHYGDNLDDWANGRYHPMLFSPPAVEGQKKDTLVLKP